jgi:cytochrome b subunit of formate dehydrogenase
MNDDDKEKSHILLEEWKQNANLYIDQDKRGLERIKMFLTVNAGLFVLYGILWDKISDPICLITVLIVSITGFLLSLLTKNMSVRAHQYIILRINQGIFIEKALKNMISKEGSWRPESGFPTTFTREYLAFEKENKFDKEDGQRDGLNDDIKEMGDNVHSVYYNEGQWKSSIKHLQWLKLLFWGICVLWVILGLVGIAAWFQNLGSYILGLLYKIGN